MIKGSSLVVLVAVLFICLVALGQNKQSNDPCDNPQSQFEMNECSKKDQEKADAELNRVYSQVMSKLEAEHKVKLKAAELAWIKYRDANCECEVFLNQGGTIYPTVYNGCLATMTRARTKELRDFLKTLQ